MKKTIIAVAIASLSMSLAGCSLEKANPMEVKAEEKKVTAYDFDYSLELNYEEKIKATITIENGSESYVPLNVKGDALFVVKLVKDKTNQVLERQTVKLNNRTQIHRMENVVNEVYFDVPRSGEYRVEVEHQLVNNRANNYDKIVPELYKTLDVEVKESVEYNPIPYAKKRNYRYEYKNALGEKFYSEYEFYDENKIQGVSKKYGVIVYANTQQGLKIHRINDYVGDINSLEFVDESKMDLIIPKYPEIGYSWEVGKSKLTVMGVNSNAKTEYGTLKGLIRIQVKEGKKVKDYYFDEELGLVKIVQKRSNSKKDITELQLVGIEVY